MARISKSPGNAQAKTGAGGPALVNSPKSPTSNLGKSALAVRTIKMGAKPKTMPGC